jgi:hypothetical protein
VSVSSERVIGAPGEAGVAGQQPRGEQGVGVSRVSEVVVGVPEGVPVVMDGALSDASAIGALVTSIFRWIEAGAVLRPEKSALSK